MEKSGKNIYDQQHEAQLSKLTDKKDSKLVKAIIKCILPISTRCYLQLIFEYCFILNKRKHIIISHINNIQIVSKLKIIVFA